MIRNINKVKGFSLIELCIVMAILVILAGSITPIFIKGVQVKAGEKTALEIHTIEQAALAYYVANNAWPSTIQSLQNAGYLNPSWVASNPWQNPYNISSTQNSFTVSTTVPNEWTALVARDLPTSSISLNTVTSAVPSPGSGTLPAGVIIMWSGNITNIPMGWALCNGSNGTPDLRDRFIVGARQDDGGIAKTNVHGVLEKTGGEARHTLTIDEMPAHTHTLNVASGAAGSGTSGGDHGARTTSSTGGNQPHENCPPFYALAFIMKL